MFFFLNFDLKNGGTVRHTLITLEEWAFQPSFQKTRQTHTQEGTQVSWNFSYAGSSITSFAHTVNSCLRGTDEEAK